MIAKVISIKRALRDLMAIAFGLVIWTSQPANALDIAIGDHKSVTYTLGVGISSLVKIKLLPKFNIDLNPVVTESDQDSLEALGRDAVKFALVAVDADQLSSNGDIQAVANLGMADAQTTMLLVRRDVDDAMVRQVLETIFKI